jgi:probable addiction module antidote protein
MECGPMRKTPEQFALYDSADYLVDIADAAAHLEAALEEVDDDATCIAHALGTIARCGNVSVLARRVGFSREGLYKALSADVNPSFATILNVGRALGLKLRFEPIHEPDLVAARMQPVEAEQAARPLAAPATA